ncbi:hypothetical protein [Aliidiomarina soli]|uniref:DUF2157 domain-containing protein n=1 Tax=Aliidiomarina soli TaxID=1928574 RepID=A0A432WH07_9GAMM|nr:hypothetical protein [Aliidiomarina soli]RUO33090.1 hypothetical protein CWE14_07625 [Aliidiomarina soli]
MTDYTNEDLQSCVDAGILTDQQFADVKAHVHGVASTEAQPQDSEHFRLISGFNDIFVVVACALVLAALGSLFGHLTGLSPSVGVAVGAWALAEYFVRRRHMALPGVALSLAFGGASVFFLVLSFGFEGWGAGLVCLFAAALQMLFWWRFKVPVAVAMIAGTLVLGGQLTIAGQIHGVLVSIPILQLAMGIAVFIFAMWWDVKDPQRNNYRADVAFWLHILAAPLIVSGAFSFVAMYGEDSVTLWHAVAVTLIYACLALVSLWVDRRALMLAALSVLVFTYSKVLAEYGIVSLNFAITGLVVGLGLLALSVYWSRCRVLAFKALPAGLHKWTPDA